MAADRQVRVECAECGHVCDISRKEAREFLCALDGCRRFRVVLPDRRQTGVVVYVLLPVAMTAVVYLGTQPFRDVYFGQLFHDRSWFQWANTFCCSLGASLVWAIFRYCRRQEAGQIRADQVANAVLPKWQNRLEEQGSHPFVGPMRRVPWDQGNEILEQLDARGCTAGAGASSQLLVRNLFLARLHRIALYLHNTRAQNLVEMMDINRDLSSLDNAQLAQRFALARYLVFLMPVIGFLGTVYGISLAMHRISGGLAAIRDMEQFMKLLTQATGALQIAFDTTLLALIYSGLLTFLLTLANSRAESLLATLDRWIIHNILSHVSEQNTVERTMREGFALLAGGHAGMAGAVTGDGTRSVSRT